jgi:hypothetical protein
MSATDEEQIIAVAEAMMRQSRRAGGVVLPVSHSYLEMPKRTTPILYRDLLEDAAIILGALDKNDGPPTRGMSKRRVRFSCVAWVCSGWVVRLEMAARLAEPWQVGLTGAIVFLGAWVDLTRFHQRYLGLGVE